MTRITLAPVTDFAALGERWRALEDRADCSFFQSWTWTGCLAEERFPDPVLLEATEAGETIALALFNRRRALRETLVLGETGVAAQDSPFIEYNSVVMDRRRASPALLAACLQAARREPAGSAQAPDGAARPLLPRRLVLSGVESPTLEAARRAGPVAIRRRADALFVDLARLRQEGRDFLDGLSANTRYQLRRSDRAYAAQGGLALRRAESMAEAHDFLDELVPLHQAAWRARGQPGAWAEPFFGRFHHALVDRGLPRGEIDLLKVTAGGGLVGLLYNFRYRGRAFAYQGGFAYGVAERHQKPGLTCHHQAIRFCAAAGLDSYDMLAGADRYKRSLANGETGMFWIAVGFGGAITTLGQQGARRLRNLMVAVIRR